MWKTLAALLCFPAYTALAQSARPAEKPFYCVTTIKRPSGYIYTWKMRDPRCQSQPDFLKKIGIGPTPTAAMHDYGNQVAAADVNHEILKSLQPSSTDATLAPEKPKSNCSIYPANMSDFIKQLSTDSQMSLSSLIDPSVLERGRIAGEIPTYLEVYAGLGGRLFIPDATIVGSAIWDNFGFQEGRGIGVLLLHDPVGDEPNSGPVEYASLMKNPKTGVGSWHTADRFLGGEILLADFTNQCAIHIGVFTDNFGKTRIDGKTLKIVPIAEDSELYRTTISNLDRYMVVMRAVIKTRLPSQSNTPIYGGSDH